MNPSHNPPSARHLFTLLHVGSVNDEVDKLEECQGVNLGDVVSTQVKVSQRAAKCAANNGMQAQDLLDHCICIRHRFHSGPVNLCAMLRHHLHRQQCLSARCCCSRLGCCRLLHTFSFQGDTQHCARQQGLARHGLLREISQSGLSISFHVSIGNLCFCCPHKVSGMLC